jgi:hypothetical protein
MITAIALSETVELVGTSEFALDGLALDCCGHARSQEFPPYEPRLLLTTKRNKQPRCCPKGERPLNVIHGSARFSARGQFRRDPFQWQVFHA